MSLKFLRTGAAAGNAVPDATGAIYTVSGLKAGSSAILYGNGTQIATATVDGAGKATWTLGTAPGGGTIITYDGVVFGSGGTVPSAGTVPPAGSPSPTLSALTLTGTSYTAGAAPGTIIGAIQGQTAGSTLSLQVSNSSAVALSGTNLVVGASAPTQAGTFSITLRETLAGATNTPRDTVQTITVVAAVAQALVLPGAPVAVYSLRKYGSYTGPCLRVRRETDNVEQDIGFSGNAFDIAAAQTFAGVLTQLRVTKAYDQTGNVNHATNTNPANQPLLQLNRTVNGLPTITFDGTGSGTTVIRYLDIPTSVAPDRSANSVFFIGALNVSKQKAAAWEFSQSSVIYTAHTNPADLGFQVYNGATSHISGLQPPVNPMVLGITSDVSTDTIYVADKSDTRAGGLGATTLAGGRIGGSLAGAGYNGQQDMFAFVVYGSALSSANVISVQSGAKAAFLLDDSFTKQVVFDGDSITEGYGTAGLRNYVNKTIPALNTKSRVYNLGVFGETFGTMQSDGVARVDSLYSTSFTRNVVSIAAGSNDIANGVTAGALQTTFQNYCATRRAKGFKIVAHTILPRTDVIGTNEANRTSYNSWLRANYATYADALADWAADSNMSVATDATYYNSDGTHPTDAGYTRLATITTAAINGVL